MEFRIAGTNPVVPDKRSAISDVKLHIGGPITTDVDCWSWLERQPYITTNACGYGSRPPCAIGRDDEAT
jgi:hypothetical protein